MRRALQAELEQLLGPEVGPDNWAHGGAHMERLSEDARLAGEIRERYESGRSVGRFPALSGFLAGATDEDIERFFRVAWARIVVLPSAPPDPKPWDHAPWNGSLESYREDLYAGMTFGLPDVRALAREWLEELLRVGYYGMEESLGLPLKQRSGEYSSPPRPLPLYGEAYPTCLGGTGQTVWLQLDGPRSRERGYREISVSDKPLRTDAAILAALTALEVRPLDLGILREVLPEIMPLRGESFWDRWTGILEDRRTDGKLRTTLRELRHHQTLDYFLALLRYHRPGFDDLPPLERADLIAETCGHANEFLEALRKMVAFLEHGRPNRRGPATTRVTARDVKAAVLKDVDGLTYRKIGEELCIPAPANIVVKGDHPTVRKMVGRGRMVLEAALGEEGWRRQAEAMRVEAARWRSISAAEQEAEIESEILGVPYEETPWRIEKEGRHSVASQEHESVEEIAPRIPPAKSIPRS